MQSRRKWKYRYYKERKKNKQLESDRQKWIEKLEKDNAKDNKTVKYYEQARRDCPTGSEYKRIYQNTINYANAQIEIRKEISKILKGKKE